LIDSIPFPILKTKAQLLRLIILPSAYHIVTTTHCVRVQAHKFTALPSFCRKSIESMPLSAAHFVLFSASFLAHVYRKFSLSTTNPPQMSFFLS